MVTDRTRSSEASVHETASELKQLYPWADIESVELNYALNMAHRRLREGFNQEFDSLGVRRMHGRLGAIRVLFFAKRPINHQELGSQLDVTPGTVTAVVTSLVTEGLARRVPELKDRRTTFIELTDKGEELARRLLAVVPRRSAIIFERLRDDEKAMLLRLLFKFLDADEPPLGAK